MEKEIREAKPLNSGGEKNEKSEMQPSDLKAPELSKWLFHDDPYQHNRHFLIIAYIPAPRYGPVNTECIIRSNLSQIEMVEIASDWVFKGKLIEEDPDYHSSGLRGPTLYVFYRGIPLIHDTEPPFKDDRAREAYDNWVSWYRQTIKALVELKMAVYLRKKKADEQRWQGTQEGYLRERRLEAYNKLKREFEEGETPEPVPLDTET